MRGSICGVLALIAIAGLALPVAGQVASNQTATNPTSHPVRVTRLPYTAEYKEHSVTPGPNGNSVSDFTRVDAVDSQGRQMRSLVLVSHIIPTSNGEMADITSHAVGPSVHVTDPEAGTNSYWQTPRKIVKVTAIHRNRAALSSCATNSSSTLVATRGSTRSESVDLGTRIFRGIEARGTFTTTTRTADSNGDNVPRVSTEEVWEPTAPGLKKLVVYRVSNDQTTGQNITYEYLGIKKIAGFEACGTLTTITSPAATDGDNVPQVRTLEWWSSTAPGLEKLVIYDVSDGPITGKSTTELVNLIQGEPDPSLFQPPADFKIVREKEPETICPSAQNMEPKPDSPSAQ
jgi:hypothetical protein